MNVSTTIPPTVEIRRTRLFGLVVVIAALAAAITWVVLAFAVDAGNSTTQAVTPSVVATPLTAAEQSIGSYLFGASTGLTPAQLQTIRNYQMGAAIPLTAAEQSIGSYLFGASTGLTPAQLRSVRNYFLGASSSVTPVERSVGNYLFGASDSLTPAQLRSIRNYLFGASATTGVSARGS